MKLLVVRRDNIGDLVCTTPLFTALRRRFPEAEIEALVNTYNGGVLAGHPDVDVVHAYEKRKHGEGLSWPRIYGARLALLGELRRRAFDVAILAGAPVQRHALSLVRWIRARSIIGFVEQRPVHGISVPVEHEAGAALHEVADAFRLLAPLGIDGPPPPLRVMPSETAVARANAAWECRRCAGLRVAIQISARKPSQRWGSSSFAELARRIRAGGDDCMILWSPGRSDDPRHPGDDEKVRSILTDAGEGACFAYPTMKIEMLVGALASSDVFVGPDGGAMHLAAGLGKPVVAMFGDSNPERWKPWGVPSRVLQAPSRGVADISVDEVLAAYDEIAGSA